jgi:ABC-2 type transport system permease protein
MMLARAFLLRDFVQDTSYRLYFIWLLGSLLFSILILLFLSRMIASSPPPEIVRYGGDYFSFAIVGFALAEAMWACLASFAGRIRYDQVVGTIEAMMATPVPMPRLLLCSGIYPLLFCALRITLLLLAATLLGAHFQLAAVLRTLPVLLLALAIFGTLGLASASLTLVLKRGDPIAALLAALSFIFGGTLYPVSSLPEPVQWLSFALPITWAIEACRKLLLTGAALADVKTELVVLAAFAVGCALAAWLITRWCVALLLKNGGIRSY